MRDRERTGRAASPTAAVIGSQTVKTTESGGPRGFHAGKKIKGRKRHAMVDTDGRALTLQAHSGAVQDRDGAGPLLQASRARWPFVQLGFADAGYRGEKVAAASPIRIEIVQKLEGQVGLAVHARRWVERFFASINRTGAWPRTSRPRSLRPRPSSTPRPACSCYEGSLVDEQIRDGLSKNRINSRPRPRCW